MSESPRVLVDRIGAVAHVRLNRPEKRNGLDLAMFEQLVACGLELRDARDVRAVVLSGEGPAFCAGLDFKSFMSQGKAGTDRMLERGDAAANLAQRVAWVWQEVPMPVIAAVHGVAFGGGLQIALGCDMRYAKADAKFSVMEIKWGLIPDMSITQTLPRLVGTDVAKELTFTGRIVSGEEALSLGMVTRVCEDPLAAALETAELIAQKSPHAIRASKRMFNESAGMSVAESLAFETELQLPILGSKNQFEAVRANMVKETPNFEDP